jgi:hypothetical protein
MERGNKSFIKSSRIIIPIIVYLILMIPIFYLYSTPAPETETQIYKGVWVPFTTPTYMDDLKDMGVNTVSLSHEIGSPDIFKLLLISNIISAHKNGMKVIVSTGYTEPYPPVEEIDMEALNSEIIEIAKLAEKYNAEFFAPFLDVDCIFLENSTEWMQEILVEIKKVYSGEMIWKGALWWEIMSGDLPSEGWPTNFSGYDYIGFGISPHDQMTLKDYEGFVDIVIDQNLFWAERDGLKGVMVLEFSVFSWGPHDEELNRTLFTGVEHSEEEVARAYEIVFEKGQGKLDGFFPFGMKGDHFGEPGLYGKREELVRKWYGEIL